MSNRGLIVGLTGGIASGKSLIAKYFSIIGCNVIDCDKIALEVTSPGGEGISPIVAEFGEDVLDDDGSLARSRMGEIVFSDDQKLKRLEGILHPIIRKRVFRLAETCWSSDPTTVVIVEAVLLFESGLSQKMNKNIAVVCNRDLRISRAMARDDVSKEWVENRIAAQSTDEEKIALADYVIRNEGAMEEAQCRVEEVYNKLAIT
jgi:dephospho-CoA kinase